MSFYRRPLSEKFIRVHVGTVPGNMRVKFEVRSFNWGELSCSALPVALPLYFTEWALSTENSDTVQVVVVSKCFGNTLLAILHLEIAKNLFAAGSAEQRSD